MDPRRKKNYLKSLALGLLLATLSSCGDFHHSSITVTLEDGDFHCKTQSVSGNSGEDFTFSITTSITKAVTGSSYEDFTASSSVDPQNDIRFQTLTFHNVRYSTVITLRIEAIQTLSYVGLDEQYTDFAPITHTRFNVSTDLSRFKKEGHKLIGYKDGEGQIVSLGSRVSPSESGTIVLQPVHAKETSGTEFSYIEKGSRYLSLTRYNGVDGAIVVPETIDGRIVDSIESECFQNGIYTQVVLPSSLTSLSPGAFSSCSIDELVIYDGIQSVGDSCFEHTSINNVRINAKESPAYIGTYFGSYADKVDRLIALKEKKKLVLYSGSSTRFGFDSALLDESLADYDVVNMGVYAYTESKPQIDVLSHFLNRDDILLVSPEFDTLETQMNVDDTLDFAFFAMCEANYDIIRYLPLSHYSNFFDSFGDYLSRRKPMARSRYEDGPSFYDEDGNRVSHSSYNAYGDYSLFRENNTSRKSFGIRRAYYNKSHFPASDIALFNAAYAPLQSQGVQVYFDYSPRMITSVSEDSNEASWVELGEYLQKSIPMLFLSRIEDSLLDPYYFYGTDNHLSTEGAKKRTQHVLKNLLPLL
ncbi:MAG: leucine-rich repeat protein [Bacilli bacterium]|nr:leucine-rich repeat protein [Bacilli bacterium]